jgi:hypothetical protein
METQVDYETEVLLAVFHSGSAAAEAERALHAAGIESRQSLLAPGRYQVADERLGKRFRAGIGSATVGAIVGAAIGAALAMWLFSGSLMVIVGLAIAGGFGGALVGPLYGIGKAARYDDDVARTTEIDPSTEAVLVETRSPATGTRGNAREILQRAGAIALLDIPAYEARVRGTSAPTVVEATSAGDSAGSPEVPRFGPTQVQVEDEQTSEHRRSAA